MQSSGNKILVDYYDRMEFMFEKRTVVEGRIHKETRHRSHLPTTCIWSPTKQLYEDVESIEHIQHFVLPDSGSSWDFFVVKY